MSLFTLGWAYGPESVAIQAMVIGAFDDAAMLGVAAPTLATAAALTTANTARRRLFTNYSPLSWAPPRRLAPRYMSIV
jgi:hypothetical protein